MYPSVGAHFRAFPLLGANEQPPGLMLGFRESNTQREGRVRFDFEGLAKHTS